MFAKVAWKMALFSFSIFMLLLTMGYGQGNYSQPKNWAIFSGQAKVAKPGARIDGFRSVEQPPEPDKTIWDTIRDTTSEWMGGGNIGSAGGRTAPKTELQKLNKRNKPLTGVMTVGR
ncbi:hypothetical protein thalar_02556 [Litoreibacter arenae DSM 19593]|uniref:Uncharacterized protein n=2 Tax=Litoreibacter TaxID=947567 RepID=S9QB15_9RHOB|nr:hypothetical protein thalar_02556 [Litoreibacter arenae DSM 19593]